MEILAEVAKSTEHPKSRPRSFSRGLLEVSSFRVCSAP